MNLQRWAARAAMAALLVSAAAAGAQQAFDIDFDTEGEQHDADCDGGTARIEGARNRIALSNCSYVLIQGAGNQVSLSDVDRALVQGSGNTVTDHDGDTTIERQGVNNRIVRH